MAGRALSLGLDVCGEERLEQPSPILSKGSESFTQPSLNTSVYK